MKNRITPENITELQKNDIIVYGSNESGFNGAGLALQAQKEFGARFGQGFGVWGDTFAIPTKSWTISKLDLSIIEFYISRFIAFTITKPRNRFLVTEIGCGLAGYKPQDIAPLFKEAVKYDNIHLPQRFWDVLNK